MLAVVNSCSLLGLDGYIVHVEVDASAGLPYFGIVGLPDASVRESKERVRAAIKNSGFLFPPKRVTINLAPADVKKEGPIFDLPIAIGILAATGQVNIAQLDKFFMIGELSLSGKLRAVPGVLAMISGLAQNGLKKLIVPMENAQEAALSSEVEVISVRNLTEVVEYLNGIRQLFPVEFMNPEVNRETNSENAQIDFNDIVGQINAKRALEIAAAGLHNVIFVGSPGAGKTMLARSMINILPSMSFEEALDVTKIYSVSGLLPRNNPLINERPFRAPHHNISLPSLIGGGATPKPGEISLATNGILFLDELTEYPKNVLESLRQPLEDREVLVSRVNATVKFPASFTLIAALNPCPCGYLGDDIKECICSPMQIRRYLSKISGPLLDRFDLQVHVSRINKEDLELHKVNIGESSRVVRERVESSKKWQKNRFNGSNIKFNSEMNVKQIKKHCKLTKEATELYDTIYDKYSLTMRSYNKILKIGRTIADLDHSEKIDVHHIAEAFQYRDYDRLMKEYLF